MDLINNNSYHLNTCVIGRAKSKWYNMLKKQLFIEEKNNYKIKKENKNNK